MEKSAAPINAGEWCKGGMATSAASSCCRTREWQRNSDAGSTSKHLKSLLRHMCAPANIPALLGCQTGSLGPSQDLDGELRECLSNTIPPLTFVFHQEVLSSIEQICLNAKIHTCKHLFIFCKTATEKGTQLRKKSFEKKKNPWRKRILSLRKRILSGLVESCGHLPLVLCPWQRCYYPAGTAENPSPLKIFRRDRDTNGRRKRSHLWKGKQSIISRFALCIDFTLRKVFCFILYFSHGDL